jgi:Sec-independent protein translocase protein TatA
LLAVRPRRLYAIAKHSVLESTRRMWAPYVVIVMFGVILAFAHWFLPISQQRPAEMGRLYVGTLTLLCMLLLTVMVTVLAPLSLPQDIQMQTIYTIVSKPVRRLELIWGRMLGYMTIVTVLVLIFGGISLIYLYRNVGGKVREMQQQAANVQNQDPEGARYLLDQAEQLKARMSARVPVKGSLTFIDSKNNPQIKGIDVGQELEFRSHVEGATPATAIWDYGVVPDPLDRKLLLDRRIPVESLLKPGSIEAIENDAMILEYKKDEMDRRKAEPKASAADVAQLTSESTRLAAQINKLRADSQKLQAEAADFEAKAVAAEAANKPDEANAARVEVANRHSAPIPMEMTFTIYRTTKGRVGEPVFAELEVINPRTAGKQPPFRNVFPIREYYTNKQYLPSSYLVGSLGSLQCKVRCVSPTQYLGMAESDFYILAESGNFGQNFMRGLFGIWLQAMVLTAIGVFAGTFLSWPVALLMTIAFFVAGHAAFSILRDFFMQTVLGGGPFESLIRLVSHDNQVTELAATPAVIVCKTLDSLVMPVMARMVYLIPNLASLDVSNTVAEGYAVGWPLMVQNTLVALAYAIPFSIGGFFILKNREVAA